MLKLFVVVMFLFSLIGEVESQKCRADFDEDGIVGFLDFIAFSILHDKK